MSFAHAQNGSPGHPQMQHPPHPPAAPPQPRSATLPAAAVVGVAVGVLAGIVVVRGTGQEADAATDGSSAAPVAEAAAETAPVTPDPRPAAAPEPEPVEPATPPVPDKISLQFAVTPAGAADDTRIFVGDIEVVGRTHVVDLDGAPAEVRIVARASGYKTFERTLSVSADREVAVVLEAAPKPRAGASSGGSRSGKRGGGKASGRSGDKGDKRDKGDGPAPGDLIDL